jgi:putative drug exporter of the RND superfamily
MLEPRAPLGQSAASDPRASSAQRRGAVARTAAWTVAHPKRVVFGWVLLLILAMAASHAAGAKYVNNLSLPGTDSERARQLLAHDFRAQSGDVDQLVLHTRNGSITEPAVRARVAPVLGVIARLPHVSAVISPFSPAGARAVSRDGRTAFATVSFDERADALPKAAVERVITVARGASSDTVQVELGGRAIQ